MYFRDRREPEGSDLELAATLTHAASIIISRHRENEDRARAEAALNESEERYRSVFEGVDEGIGVFEVLRAAEGDATDYRLLEVNPAFERHTGLSGVAGRLGSEVAPGTEREWFETYRDVARTGQARRFERYHEDTRRWYDVHVARLGGVGSNRVSVVFSDITQRRRAEEALRASEERLRDVLNSMAEGFALLARDFTILDVNEETLKLDGRSREELVGRSHWEAFPGTEDSALGDLYRRVMREREPGNLEFHYRWPSGREMWVDVRAYPTPDGGVACFWRDISERKTAEEALAEEFRSTAVLQRLSARLVTEENI